MEGDAIEAVAAFAREEASGHEPGEEREVRSAAFGNVVRTLTFLRLCAADADAADRAWLANHELRLPLMKGEGVVGGALMPAQLEILQRGPHLTNVVQLRIETFYFFAQRLLDELVMAMDVFFAPSAVMLGRHRSLKANLLKLAQDRGLSPSPELDQLIDDVTRRVKGFRDDHVAHTLTPSDLRKVRGLLLNPGSPPRLSIGWMNPKPHEVGGAESEDVSQLLRLLETYVMAVLAFLAVNRGRSELD